MHHQRLPRPPCRMCARPSKSASVPFPLFDLFGWLWLDIKIHMSSIKLLRDGRTFDGWVMIITFFFRDTSLTSASPVTVQQVCIPQAILGTDVLCQAKSGLGKTAVFVLTTLQQVEPNPGECSVLVMCHTRELAYQIRNELARFSKYMPEVKTAVFYGGTPMAKDIELLSNKDTHPHIIVATPGRMNALVREKKLRMANIKVFVLDECDKMLDQIGRSPRKFPRYPILRALFRHAPRCARYLPRHTYPEASHDVQCHAVARGPPYLQKVHAESVGNLCGR